MTNQTLDSRTAEEKQEDAERACMVRLETTRWTTRRQGLEWDLGDVQSEQLRKWIRKEIGRCDRALMELGAGRLPEFPCP